MRQQPQALFKYSGNLVLMDVDDVAMACDNGEPKICRLVTVALWWRNGATTASSPPWCSPVLTGIDGRSGERVVAEALSKGDCEELR